MSRTPAESIAAKLADATSTVVALRTRIATEAGAHHSGMDLSSTVNMLIEAEGRRDFWARLQQVATHASLQDDAFTKELAFEATLNMLSAGADDSWSGRGNDAKRARFDGIRSAATQVEWLF